MSEIREGFGELDKIFVDDTTDVIVSSNGNTPSPEETNPRKIKANIEKLNAVIESGSNTLIEGVEDLVNINLDSEHRYIITNMNGALAIKLFCTTVPEYQREGRIITEEERRGFHKTAFVTGKTGVVPISGTYISGILVGHEKLLDELGDRTSENSNTYDLLERRIAKYKKYIEYGYKFFTTDGQNRLGVWSEGYSDTSEEVIDFDGESRLTCRYTPGGDHASFNVKGTTFANMDPAIRVAVRDKIVVVFDILYTENIEMPLEAFGECNGGTPVPLQVNQVNSIKSLGFLNQLEIINMHEDLKGTEGYRDLEKLGHLDWVERFYGNATTGHWSSHAKGVYTYTILDMINLFGDSMGSVGAEKLKGNLLYDIGKEIGWQAFLPISKEKHLELEPKQFQLYSDIRSGQGLAIRNYANNNGKKVLGFKQAVRVNASFCAKEMLTFLSDGWKVDSVNWTQVYIDFFKWNAFEFENTKHVKVRQEHIDADLIHPDAGKLHTLPQNVGDVYLDPVTGDTQDEKDGYYAWCQDQVTVRALEKRERHIKNEFIDTHWKQWEIDGVINRKKV